MNVCCNSTLVAAYYFRTVGAIRKPRSISPVIPRVVHVNDVIRHRRDVLAWLAGKSTDRQAQPPRKTAERRVESSQIKQATRQPAGRSQPTAQQLLTCQPRWLHGLRE